MTVKEFYSKYGWCQKFYHKYVDGKSHFCLVGAIEERNRSGALTIVSWSDLRCVNESLMRRIKQLLSKPNECVNVAFYNDYIAKDLEKDILEPLGDFELDYDPEIHG